MKLLKFFLLCLKRFCDESGTWSTRKFGFMASGANLYAMLWSGMIYSMFMRDEELLLNVFLIAAAVFLTLALFVHPDSFLAQIVGTFLPKKNDKNN